MLYNLGKTSNPYICNSVLHLVMLLFSFCLEAFLRPRSSSPTLNRRWTNWENCWKKNETKEWLLRLPSPQPRSRSGGKGPRDTASLHFWPFLILCVCVLSCSVMSKSLWPHGLQPTRLLCPWGFSRQEHWSGLPCPPPGNLPNPGIKPSSPILHLDYLPSEPPGKPKHTGVGSLSLL